MSIAGFAAVLAMTAAPPVATPPSACAVPAPQHAASAGAAPKRLDTLPPASLYLALDRRVGGCLAPIIVRNDIGGSR